MRFLLAAAFCVTLTCGTVNAQDMVAPEIEVMRALSAATNEGATKTNPDGSGGTKIWKSDTASDACGCSSIQGRCGVGGWDGIRCEVISGEARVVELQIPFHRNITGNIANLDLNKLPNLRSLTITSTTLTGTLPNLSTHPTLKSIELFANPTLLGPLTTQHIPPQLERLSVRGSINFDPFRQGPLPSFDAVNATTLKYLAFDVAQVSGTLPSFERFINLEQVHMAANKISGAVPKFGPALRTLVLSDNALTSFDVAAIPATVQTLDLSKNKIVAPFPDLSKLTDPWNINLGTNGFYGNVALSQLPAPSKGSNETDWVYTVQLDDNSLTGTVPPLTRSWLQSRQAPGRTFERMKWNFDCNLFQTGALPSLPSEKGNAFCYNNVSIGIMDCSTCAPKLQGSVFPPNGNGNGNGNGGATSASSTGKAGPTDQSSSTGPKKNDAALSTTTSLFTGIFAIMAAVAARF